MQHNRPFGQPTAVGVGHKPPTSPPTPSRAAITSPKVAPRRREEEIDPDFEYRTKVVMEILSTERNYVEMLKRLVQEFVVPLRGLAEANPKQIRKEDIFRIFSNIELIINLNSELLLALEDRLANWSPTTLIGDIFLSMAPFLKLYSQYSSNYAEASRTLSRCVKEPLVKNFLESRPVEEDGSQKDIPFFLIMPIQRLPRYILLLNDLLKHTQKTHRDYNTLQQAIDKVQEVSNFIEQQMSITDNVNKVVDIHNRMDDNPEGIITPSRRFVFEGLLTEITGRGRAHPRHLFLFNDVLIISAPNRNRFRFKKKINLLTTWVKDFPDTGEIKFGFQLISEIKTFLYLATCQEEKEKWMAEINTVMDKLLERNPSYVDQKAPLKVRRKKFFKNKEFEELLLANQSSWEENEENKPETRTASQTTAPKPASPSASNLAQSTSALQFGSPPSASSVPTSSPLSSPSNSYHSTSPPASSSPSTPPSSSSPSTPPTSTDTNGPPPAVAAAIRNLRNVDKTKRYSKPRPGAGAPGGYDPWRPFSATVSQPRPVPGQQPQQPPQQASPVPATSPPTTTTTTTATTTTTMPTSPTFTRAVSFDKEAEKKEKEKEREKLTGSADSKRFASWLSKKGPSLSHKEPSQTNLLLNAAHPPSENGEAGPAQSLRDKLSSMDLAKKARSSIFVVPRIEKPIVYIPVEMLKDPIMTGYLTKQGGIRANWRRRYFVIKDSFMYYYASETDDIPIAVVTLMNSEVRAEERRGKSERNERVYYFAVSHPEQRRVYVMMATSEEERQSWMQAIQTASKVQELTDALSLPPLIPLLSHPDTVIQRHASLLVSSFLTAKNYQKIREYLEDRGGLQALISILYSPVASIQEQALKTLVSVTEISDDSARRQSVIFAGGIPPLVALLSSPNSTLQEQSIQALANITEDPSSSLYNGTLLPVVQMLSSPSVQRNAATILRNFSQSQRGSRLFDADATVGMIRHLATLTDVMAQANVAWALYNLVNPTIVTNTEELNAKVEEILRSLQKLGGIKVIVPLFSSATVSGPTSEVIIPVMKLITRLVAKNETVQEEVRAANGLQPLLALLCNENLRGDMDSTLQAAAALLATLLRNRWVRSSIEDKGTMARIVHIAKTTTNPDVLEQSLRILVNLSAVDKNKNVLKEIGLIPALVPYLSSYKESIQLQAIKAFCNLLTKEKPREEFVKLGGPRAYCTILNAQSPDKTKILVAHAIENFCFGHNEAALNAMNGCLPLLVKLLSSSNSALQSQALRAVGALSFSMRNAQGLEREGIRPLVRFITSGNVTDQSVALGTLSNILTIERLKNPFVNTHGLDVVLCKLSSSDEDVAEKALRCVATLAFNQNGIALQIVRGPHMGRLTSLAASSSLPLAKQAKNALEIVQFFSGSPSPGTKCTGVIGGYTPIFNGNCTDDMYE